MIRNKNLIFQHITDASKDSDKYFRLPRVAANSKAPTASTAIDGAMYWDNENDVLYICKAGSWKAVTVAS